MQHKCKVIVIDKKFSRNSKRNTVQKRCPVCVQCTELATSSYSSVTVKPMIFNTWEWDGSVLRHGRD